MQAAEPIGGPWPHDMVLSIETNPSPLIDLLYARAVWNIPAGATLGPLTQPPVEHLAAPGDPDALAASWDTAWDEAVAFTAGSDTRRRRAIDLIPDVSTMSDADVLAQFTQPSWQPLEHLDRNAVYQWQQTLPQYHQRPLDQHPERRSIADMVAAWERGLTTLVVIPIQADYVQQVSDSAILLSHHSYDNETAFENALRSFGTAA